MKFSKLRLLSLGYEINYLHALWITLYPCYRLDEANLATRIDISFCSIDVIPNLQNPTVYPKAGQSRSLIPSTVA